MITEEQRIARLNGVGASDAAAVLGMHPYMTPYELWLIKTRKQEPKEILTPERLRIRNAHESTIADEYATRHNVDLRRVNETVYHDKHKFMFCHIDRKVKGVKKIIECKSSMSWMGKAFGKSGTSEVPDYYIIQQQYMYLITGYREGDIAALIDIDDYREFPIPPNDKIMALLEERVIHFWQEYIEKDVPPPLANRNDVQLMFPRNIGTYKEVADDALMVLTQIKDLRARAKIIENEREKLQDDLTMFIQDADGLTLNDEVLCTWKATVKGSRVLRIMGDK